VLPAFAMVLFFVILRLPFALAMLATVLVSTLLLGVGVKELLITRLLKMGVLPLVIATIGLSLLIRYSLQQFWTPLALPFPAVFSRAPIRLGTIVVSLEEIGNILFAAVVIGALQLFITRTKLGWAMQAVAQNRTLAAVLGIDVSRLVTITFVLNAALTAVAAVLIAPGYLVKYDIGVGLRLKAFYAAIIGGFNPIRRAPPARPLVGRVGGGRGGDAVGRLHLEPLPGRLRARDPDRGAAAQARGHLGREGGVGVVTLGAWARRGLALGAALALGVILPAILDQYKLYV